MINFEKSTAEFNAAIKAYIEESKRDVVETINKKSKDIILRTIKYTPKADVTKVRSYWQVYGYQILNKKGLKKTELQKLVAKAVKKHASSIGYIKAGWYKAAQAFGGKGGKVSSAGYAADGRGIKATQSKQEARFNNWSTGASEISSPALERAMEEVKDDMIEHVKENIEKKWAKI